MSALSLLSPELAAWPLVLAAIVFLSALLGPLLFFARRLALAVYDLLFVTHDIPLALRTALFWFLLCLGQLLVAYVAVYGVVIWPSH